MKENRYVPNYKLRRARELRGWTQKEVADYIELPDTRTFRRWENGEAFPSLRYRARLCEVFQHSPEDLGLILEHPSKEASEAILAAEHDEPEKRNIQVVSLLPPTTLLSENQRDLVPDQDTRLGVVMVIVTLVGTMSILLPFALKRVRR